MTIAGIAGFMIVAKPYAELLLFLLVMFFGAARGSIATVSEVMASGVKMTNDEALQKASDLMAKIKIGPIQFSWLPEQIRKWIIQQAFDSMKKVAVDTTEKMKAKTQAVSPVPEVKAQN
jgi:hypothetical protein